MGHPTYNGFETVIGLEVHAQLATDSKLFSASPNQYGNPPNRNINPVCTAQPGALPVLNRRAVDFAIRAGLATNCEIREVSIFSRKNYFYPDLPKGYQISQFDKPICEAGHLEIEFENEPGVRETKKIRITRIHMEEDAGKSQHMVGFSLVDLNRAGTPLIEIVSEPDFRSAFEASAYLRKLRAILQYIDVCDGNMQEGNFRCDANVSVRRVGETKLGTRAELKNLNSFRFVEKAIEYEIQRQINVINSGGRVVQETRLYDSAKNITASMRSKEEAHDYRYFPEPDLPPLVVSPAWIEKVRASLPELPDTKALRFVKDFGIPEYDARVITSTRALAHFYEEAVSHSAGEPKLVSNWLMTEVLRGLKDSEKEIEDCPFPAKSLGELIALIKKGEISSKIAKTVFEEMWASGKDPASIVKEKGLVQVSDPSAIEAAVRKVMASSPKNVEEYRAGKEKLFGFFIGQTMKETGGKANPALLNEIVKAMLKGDK
ncbi:MAG: Asp-tRNA(Asn)/Glu-tRNA(Gln) amidotransferase subunit GatB [Proteobacteria bacterium]|nr:MAG: Asp-tRNA(Asn)/Glu-tRNA(Gln) amidotransferase subunit GatB [Pseudomonadota bacterium]